MSAVALCEDGSDYQRGTYCLQIRSGTRCPPHACGGLPLGDKCARATVSGNRQASHLVLPLTVCIAPAQHDRHRREPTHRGEEERAVLQVSIVVHDDEDDEARERDGDAADEEDEAPARPVGHDRGEHREDERARPWWDREELGVDRAVTERLDDRGCEVR